MVQAYASQSTELILALDVGTLSVRAVVYDQLGHTVVTASHPIQLNRINDVQIEQDPNEILECLFIVMDEVFGNPKVLEKNVGVAGLTTQRSSVVAWERTSGKAITPVLSWQDRRAHAYLKPLQKKAHAIKSKSGLFVTPHYGASKLRWLLDHEPKLKSYQENGRFVFGPLAAFIIFNLLQNEDHRVDHVNASRTQLMNLSKREWSKELLALFKLSQEQLPTCQPTQSHFGFIRNTTIPLNAVNGDQNAAIHGTGSLEEGTFIVNIGTGAFVLLPTGDRPIHHPRLLASIANSNASDATYLLEGTVNGAGAAIQWAVEQWNQPDIIEHLAQWLVEVEEPPIFVNTIGGLGSPMWTEGPAPHFSEEGTIAEKAVAIIESIAFLIQINLETMVNTGQDVKQIRISGGLSALDGLCQLIANISQRLVVRTEVEQTTARGIAWLAAKPTENWNTHENDYFLPRQNRPLQSRYRNFCTLIGWH
ncbi:MAG: FGGY family carbohydrate kinase [Chloroflexota bacterium]